MQFYPLLNLHSARGRWYTRLSNNEMESTTRFPRTLRKKKGLLMRPYAINSPQAMARVLAMLLVSSDHVGDDEFNQLEALEFYSVLGISHTEFMQILHGYCEDISDEATDDGTIHLIDRERINSVLDDVSDPKKRVVVAAVALDVIKAGLEIDEAEMILFTHMLEYWRMTLDDIQATFAV